MVRSAGLGVNVEQPKLEALSGAEKKDVSEVKSQQQSITSIFNAEKIDTVKSLDADKQTSNVEKQKAGNTEIGEKLAGEKDKKNDLSVAILIGILPFILGGKDKAKKPDPFDINQDGKLNGIEKLTKQIHKLMKSFDINKDGELDDAEKAALVAYLTANAKKDEGKENKINNDSKVINDKAEKTDKKDKSKDNSFITDVITNVNPKEAKVGQENNTKKYEAPFGKKVLDFPA